MLLPTEALQVFCNNILLNLEKVSLNQKVSTTCLFTESLTDCWTADCSYGKFHQNDLVKLHVLNKCKFIRR